MTNVTPPIRTTVTANGTGSRPISLGVLVLVGLGLVVLTAIGPLLHRQFGGFAHWAVVLTTAAAALWVTRADQRLPKHGTLMVIAAVAIAMRLAMLAYDPYLSDDIYRYVWDGRVQGAGINPYRHIPSAPELAPLREAAIYPFINRADYAPTIYPPTAQMFYFLTTRFGESVLVMRLALIVCEGAAIAATLLLLRRLSQPPTRIAAFAWHPLAVWEIAGNGHVDALMVALLLGALLTFLADRPLAAGVIAAAAALVKPTALLALPVFWRPWNWRLVVVCAATVLALYVPYLAVGTKVLGFLPGYLHEEELSHGSGFRYVMMVEALVGPRSWLTPVYAALAATILIAIALAAGFRRDRSPEGSITALAVMLTAFLVLLTPHYPWYYLVLVPFLAVYPASWTLWLLTVGGLQTYQVVPGEWLPDYILRQNIFHALVVAAIIRDIRATPQLWASIRTPIRDRSAGDFDHGHP